MKWMRVVLAAFLAVAVGVACDYPMVIEEDQAAPAVEGQEWTSCGPDNNLECGFVEVPADYRNPEAGSIRIAINVHRATAQDERIGYLLVNPGGPGESGTAVVRDLLFGVFAEDLIKRFDILGFDPRGVGLSEPDFACGAPGEQLGLLATIDMPVDTAEEVEAGEAAANLCIQSMGPVGGLLHSEYVVRDMDEIRKALGGDQISYMGFSYGSALGVWYATLFPQHVRAMVVDGADDPVDAADTLEERVSQRVEEAAPFAGLLAQALAACADPECPIYNDGDPVDYYMQAAEKLELVNAVANHPSAGAMGIVTTLYRQETWPLLWEGLFKLKENDDPSLLHEFSVFQLGDEPGAVSFTEHVNCLDKWVLQPELDRQAQLEVTAGADVVIDRDFPLLGVLTLSPPSACPYFDQFAPAPLDRPLDGGDVPILIIGNHSDPATPFTESEQLATQTLSNGYLVETSHPSHIVYPKNQCVNSHVHNVLLETKFPDEQRVYCEPEA